MSIAIIINPIAGGAGTEVTRRRAELAADVVAGRGEICEVFITERRGHARELATTAVRRGSRLVMAWGGDGTMNEVASALAFSDTPMGIVPAGSGNGLALELGIPSDGAGAIVHAMSTTPRSIDLGELDGRLFVNVAGIGFDAHVAARFNAPENRRRGFVGYVLVSIPLLVSYSTSQYRICANGLSVSTSAMLITIANGPQFGNGARLATTARVDDGELDMVVVEERSRLRTLYQLPRLFYGGADRIPGCSFQRIRAATFESDTDMRYHIDGEPFLGGRRLEARIHPGALKVCA